MNKSKAENKTEKTFFYTCKGVLSKKMNVGQGGDLLELLEKHTHTLPQAFDTFSEEEKKDYKKRSFDYFIYGSGKNEMFLNGDTFFNREDKNLNLKHCITLDIDKGETTPEALKNKAEKKGLRFALFATISSTKERPRFRLVVPTSRGMNRPESLESVKALAEYLEVKTFDNSSSTFTQLQGVPIAETVNHFKPFYKYNGEPFDVDKHLNTQALNLEEIQKNAPEETQGSDKMEVLERENCCLFNQQYYITKDNTIQEETQKLEEFKHYLDKNKKRLTEDPNAYNNALSVICTLAKTLQDKEITEETARKCAKWLAFENKAWERGNLWKLEQFLKGNSAIFTPYSWAERITYGTERDEETEEEEQAVYQFESVGRETVFIPKKFIILDRNGRFKKLVPVFDCLELFTLQNGFEFKYNLYTKKLEVTNCFKDKENIKAEEERADPSYLQDFINLYREKNTGLSVEISQEIAKMFYRRLGVRAFNNPVLNQLEKHHALYPAEALEPLEEFSKLWACIELTHNEEENRVFLGEIFKKFFLQCIHLAHNTKERNYTGEFIPILYSETQGIGKSLLSRLLCEKIGLLSYFRDDLNAKKLDQKDEVIKWSSCFIGEIAELRQGKKTLDDLKQRATQASENIRLPYTPQPLEIPCCGCYIITTNRREILHERYNRRFPIFDLKKIDIEKLLKKINFSKVWAELYHTYKKHEEKGEAVTCFRLSAEERGEMTKKGKAYQNTAPSVDTFADIYDVESDPQKWEWAIFSTVALNCGISTTQAKEYKGLKRSLEALGYDFKIGTANKTYIKAPPKKTPYN